MIAKILIQVDYHIVIHYKYNADHVFYYLIILNEKLSIIKLGRKSERKVRYGRRLLFRMVIGVMFDTETTINVLN